MNNYYNKIIQDDMRLLLKRNIEYTKLNNKNVLITGGTGLLASYIVYFLIFLNENIDNFRCNIFLLLRDKNKAIERFGEILKRNYIKLYFDDINYIIHAASIADTHYFKNSPVDVIKPNTIGTYNLLELSLNKKIESFLFFSTCSIYGKSNQTKKITENDYGILDPLDDNSCYSESKRCGENLCVSYWRQNGIPTKIARISHTYGPTIDLKTDNRVFSNFINDILDKRNIRMKSNGLAVRSFCYIVDSTDAFFKILLNGKNGECYNVSNENSNISIRKLSEILSNMYSIGIEYINNDYMYVENKFSNSVIFDTEKLKKLGWEAKFGIDEGFKRTIDSFEVNENEEN